MTELEYIFCMDFGLNVDSMEEISSLVEEPAAHAMIDGGMYALDSAGVKRYRELNDSLDINLYALAFHGDVPYAALLAAVLPALTQNKPPTSPFLDELFLRSLYDPKLHGAVCSCIDYDERIFSGVKAVIMPSGKKMLPGDFVNLKKTVATYIAEDGSLYVHQYDSTDGYHDIKHLSVDKESQKVDFHTVFSSKEESAALSAMVSDMLPPNASDNLRKKLIQKLNLPQTDEILKGNKKNEKVVLEPAAFRGPMI